MGVAGGGRLVQAHLAARSLLPCSDEVALSHKELHFHCPAFLSQQPTLHVLH